MRRIYGLWTTFILLLLAVPPVMAAEGNPLENAFLIPGWVGGALAGLAILLFLLFGLWARRGPG